MPYSVITVVHGMERSRVKTQIRDGRVEDEKERDERRWGSSS